MTTEHPPLTDEEATTARLRLATLLELAGAAPRSPDVLLARWALQLERERDDLRAVVREYGSVPGPVGLAAQASAPAALTVTRERLAQAAATAFSGDGAWWEEMGVGEQANWLDAVDGVLSLLNATAARSRYDAAIQVLHENRHRILDSPSIDQRDRLLPGLEYALDALEIRETGERNASAPAVPDLESEAAQEAIEKQARAMFESWKSESVEVSRVHIAMCIAETQGVRTPWSRLSDAQRGAYLATADAVIALQGASAPAVPPAPAPGELAEQREKLWALIRAYRAESAGDLVGVAGAIGRIVDPLFENAAKWQQLQWRPASEAPPCKRVLFRTAEHGVVSTHVGQRWEDGGWSDTEENYESVLGFIPLDALPTLPGGDANG